jgi:hypothetical protein
MTMSIDHRKKIRTQSDNIDFKKDSQKPKPVETSIKIKVQRQG